jgi:hypothetical protein
VRLASLFECSEGVARKRFSQSFPKLWIPKIPPDQTTCALCSAAFHHHMRPKPSEPMIMHQVFVLNRKDYIEYFESETSSCQDDATFAGCRKNPCISIESKQVDGTESCFSVDANAGYAYRAAAGSGLECAYNTYGGVSYQDAHCHIGKCTRGAARTLKWTEGCPAGVDQCCNDKFLQTYCLNQPCTEIGRRASNVVRHTTETANADLGYGIMIRNMGEQTIKVNGKVSIHNKEYPCTLLDCCRTGSKCCSSLYKMPFGTQGTCNVRPPLPPLPQSRK